MQRRTPTGIERHLSSSDFTYSVVIPVYRSEAIVAETASGDPAVSKNFLPSGAV